MKVICIDAKPRAYSKPSPFVLIEGNEYNVIGEFLGENIYGRRWTGYEIAENPGDSLYDKDRFIPLSTIDETELLTERNLQHSYH